MRPGFAIGIDGGATSTKVAVTNERGEILGRAQGACISPYLLDAPVIESNFSALIDDSLRAAGVSESDVLGICLGVSGCEREDERDLLERIARERFPRALAVAANDALVALVGGIGEPRGIITISGTGSISFGVNDAGETARSGGWGHLLGDEGSGFEIARQALVATLRASDGRGPETELTQLILDRLGLATPEEIKPWLRRADFDKATVADLAPLVFEAASKGDRTSESIISTAGEELALSTFAVGSRLWEADAPIRVVVVGGVILSQGALFKGFTSHLCRRLPNAEVLRPKSDPAHGACTYVLHLLNQQDRVGRI